MLAAGAAGVAGLPEGMAEALAEPRRAGTLGQIEHVVILMQENRSFDHYFGTMSGVRGFGDKRAVRLPSGGYDPVLQLAMDTAAGAGVGTDLASGSAGTGSASGSSSGSADSGSGGGAGTRDAFHQPDAFSSTGFLLPWHVDTTRVDGQDLGDLAHDWNTTHLAWADGAYHSWIASKSKMTMGYFTEADIPFHRALAAAFTICDHYFCSIQGPTTPNRLFHWTGTIDPRGSLGGPAVSNPPDYRPVYRWTTYPERLQQAGISWQVYADNHSGGDFLADFGDNPLWLFQAYHDAAKSADPAIRQLAERANVTTTGMTPAPAGTDGTDVDYVLQQFISDCAANKLPQVSWVVAPAGYSEHPAYRPADGAAYLQRVLKALWDNPKLWESTVLLVNYDENDGFFDHVVPPTAPPGTPDEILAALEITGGDLNSGSATLGLGSGSGSGSAVMDTLISRAGALLGGQAPIGLGPRVPMLVISPWSRGGWVNSQVFDHTSVLQFLEQWTGVAEPNISAWRRAVCGDLTSCFDFGKRDNSIPTLPDANAERARAAGQKNLPKATPPSPAGQRMPVQDGGRAKARALPYQPVAWVEASAGGATVRFGNQGRVAMPFQTYAYHDNSVRQTVVDPGGTAQERFQLGGAYDFAVHAPNGFLVEATGGADTAGIGATAAVGGSADRPTFVVTVSNTGSSAVTIEVSGSKTTIDAGSTHDFPAPLDEGWYDLTLTVSGNSHWRRHFAGHLENGRPSSTG
ncbi:phospholipase C, phosphocholine-specific [Nocardia sp. CDC160]|nr:phospholipase C, phosphocholine-specific [Nocardia sp. CDC160]MEC3915734.1 phospholipase C, phosphocholine-specific [Nocardia sp. CDC160]